MLWSSKWTDLGSRTRQLIFNICPEYCHLFPSRLVDLTKTVSLAVSIDLGMVTGILDKPDLHSRSLTHKANCSLCKGRWQNQSIVTVTTMGRLNICFSCSLCVGSALSFYFVEFCYVCVAEICSSIVSSHVSVSRSSFV